MACLVVVVRGLGSLSGHYGHGGYGACGGHGGHGRHGSRAADVEVKVALAIMVVALQVCLLLH